MSRPSIRALKYGPVFSWSKQHDGLIYTSGHAAVGVDDLEFSYGDFEHEARVALENLQRTLVKAGSSLDKVVKVTCYMTDLANYAAFNKVYGQFFTAEQPPVRTCVEVRRLPYDFKLEIEVIAAS